MSTNDITGDSITTATKHNSKAFRDNYDAIFNKEKQMVKNFSTLKNKMSPEAQVKAEARTSQMLSEMKAEQAPFDTTFIAEELPKGMMEDVHYVHKVYTYIDHYFDTINENHLFPTKEEAEKDSERRYHAHKRNMSELKKQSERLIQAAAKKRVDKQ